MPKKINSSKKAKKAKGAAKEEEKAGNKKKKDKAGKAKKEEAVPDTGDGDETENEKTQIMATLDVNWFCYVGARDSKTGKKRWAYNNSVTGETTWDGEKPKKKAEDLPPGWTEYDVDGRTAYYNTESGETQWEKPGA